MLIRIARFDNPPPDDRDWVIDALRTVPGVRAAYHALDRDSGAVLSISIYDDRAAADAAVEAISASATARNHHGTHPDGIRFCEVVRSLERAPEQSAEATR